ncbi:DUF448 domain-containing protein [Helicobacter sp. MIT 21-1697]|uniref:DUF448 domain-containing protein n=1 Tax=Helicobacter sp. MIT 21-1697 TaxID=2993733 RepID=UPI00224B8BA5|nr:DUF448 domain-containing protein [Helicobacter sp. MIT 21-1697]MCX2717743.1 DUF448 domain-containing protein [Helicobacter sp. MIT 21-1697]
MKQPKQMRMCVKCRKRFCQKELLRLQSNGYSLCRFSGRGRSFYVCEECLEQPKTLQTIIKMNKLKPSEHHVSTLKEIWNLWKK